MPDTPTDPAAWPTLEAVVRQHVLATCERCGWHIGLTADALGVATKTVYNHLHRYEEQGFVVHETTTNGDRGAWRIKA